MTGLLSLVEQLEPAMRTRLDGPFAFFGHSMGAIVAFEQACRLRDAGLPLPIVLFASGAEAPGCVRGGHPLHTIDDDRQLLQAVVARYGGNIENGLLESSEMIEIIAPALRADLMAIESYQPSRTTPLPLGIVSYRGANDRNTTEMGQAAWRGHTSAAFRQRVFDGGHFFLHDAQDAVLDDVVAHLRDWL